MITPCSTDQSGRPLKKESRQPGRNDDCPCGSGAKFKHCCLRGQKAERRETAAPWPSQRAEAFEYSDHGSRSVRANFSAGMITSDGGVMVWRELEEKFGIIEEVARCFDDYRDQSLIEFELEELLAQRIFGLLEGYEDLNDHDDLRGDQAFGAAIGRDDPTGMDRRRDQDKHKPGAGKSTFNRLELSAEEGTPFDPYKKIVPDLEALRDHLTERTLELIEEVSDKPDRVVIDLDPSDVLLHGEQEGRHYHNYYGDYCYLPLYAFVARWPLDVLLCRSSQKPARDAQETIHRLVETVRDAWEECTVVVRGDGDFSKVPELMEWIEDQQGVEFIFGLAQNSRLKSRITEPLQEAYREFQSTGEAARRYTGFAYKPKTDSWSHKRRVVAKAEYLPGDEQHVPKENTRFGVTSIEADEIPDQMLYEDGYCPRGDSENAIFEVQQKLFGNRASTAYESSNQLRMLWSAIAGLFVVLLRRVALQETPLQGADIETIRNRLLKVGAQIEVTERHIWFRYSSHFPQQHLLATVTERIRAGPG